MQFFFGGDFSCDLTFSEPLITDGLLLTPNFLFILTFEAVRTQDGTETQDTRHLQLSSDERDDTDSLLNLSASAALSSLMTLL